MDPNVPGINMSEFNTPEHFDPGFMRGPSPEERRGYALQMAVTLYAGASPVASSTLADRALAAADQFVRWLESGES